jgi:ubiquinone/menaquinone biosynthesis C-methylase UbiE
MGARVKKPPGPDTRRINAAPQPAAVPVSPEEKRRAFRERTEQFLRLGHDRMAAAGAVAEAVGECDGPVLDVGTGRGLLAMALARRGPEVVTVDSSAEDRDLAVALAEEAGLSGTIRFLQSDAVRLPFPDGHFAACATMDVLHHLENGGAVLAEMARVLRPGGTLVVAEFDARGFEIVGKVHREEGRTHPEGPVTSAWAEGYLSGLGLVRTGGLHAHEHLVSVFLKPDEAEGKGPWAGTAFERMGREDLLKALDVFAKNWLAHDGCWFLAAEDRYGQEAAIDLDGRSWARFAVAEATRIMSAFQIPQGGGLEALSRVLQLRMYALINPQRMEWSADRKRLRFTMESCRVQTARRRKGLPDFPCKPVGKIEFGHLARTVDPRIRVLCISSPPDPSGDGGCIWEFTLEE